MKTEFYAHSLPQEPSQHWHRLEDHLRSVAEMSRQFAEDFNAGEWGYLAGMWHDLGKYSKQFQDYLRRTADFDSHVEDGTNRVDHSTAGAQHAVTALGIMGHLLAYAIAGHHSGLLNGRGIEACQETRLCKPIPPWKHGLQFLREINNIELPTFLRNAFSRKDSFSVAFFVRMIFSCLIDADFLDTEAFMNPRQGALRQMWPGDTLAQMEEALTEFVQTLNIEDNWVNQQRALVRNACLKAAEEKPGLFSLTVPTGGGKTLSSLAFALRHAVKHGLQRVIYVIPLTSIIEQNADVFRDALRPIATKLNSDVVVEHHSNLDPEKETFLNRLAAENWDAPLIVTTSVQFYETLFANRTSKCRKMHRLARSVIILDEAQTLPVEFLKPCLFALRELTNSYGATIVLCTATQPAIERRKGFEIGLEKPSEIIPNPTELYARFRRVCVKHIGRQSDREIYRRMEGERQALCIVNTRLHAKNLFKMLGPRDGHFHLSGNMCPAHRAEKLKLIRERLDGGYVCRVVSTQIVEAGVDVDFPVVFRSLAGLDSIAQAAGRCNRHGRLPQQGRTYVFESEHPRSERFLSDTAQCARQILTLHRDILDLKAIEQYFRLYYWDQSVRWDEKRIMDSFTLINDKNFPFNFGFMQAAEAFQFIDNANARPVCVPWQVHGRRLCERLRAMPAPTLEIYRELQRYVVQVPRWLWEKHVGTDIQMIHGGISILVSPELHYSEDIGLNFEAEESSAFFA